MWSSKLYILNKRSVCNCQQDAQHIYFSRQVFSRNVANNDGQHKEQTRVSPTTNRSVAEVIVVALVDLCLANSELRHVFLAAAEGDGSTKGMLTYSCYYAKLLEVNTRDVNDHRVDQNFESEF